MATTESFEIELDGGTVRGTLQRPESASEAPVPGVLLCRGVYVASEQAADLLDALAESLCSAGVAVVRFEHRCADLILDDFHAHCVSHDIEDAAAVLAWMLQATSIDATRIGLLGYSLGAIAAAATARRTPAVWGLCLLSGATAAYVAARSGGGNGSTDLVDPLQMPSAYAPSLQGIDSPADAAHHDRPTLIVHGAADRIISPAVSFDYLTAIETSGRRVEHVLVARADHAFAALNTRATCLERVCGFFRAMLEQPAAMTPVGS